MNILPLHSLKDNYIWCLQSENNKCVIVDPGSAEPVLDFLKTANVTFYAILITHHHYDHTGGIKTLLDHYPDVPVYGPANDVKMKRDVFENELLDFPEAKMRLIVFEIPGHTLDHVAYYTPGYVFTGDTLFTGGCGRIFEGTPTIMYSSLQKLQSLPDPTLIYCGHEYTENNLKFALLVEPNNRDIQTRLQETQSLRRQDLPTVPATLSLEKKTNPFLRCDQPEVMRAASNYAGNTINDPVKTLEVLREWKNSLNL